jgi:hypothetical protein
MIAGELDRSVRDVERKIAVSSSIAFLALRGDANSTHRI